MSRFCLAVLVFVFCTFIASNIGKADTVKLTNGQVHKGVITAEESDRVQLKLEGSGARIWFMKDQIETLHKKNPDDDLEEDTPADSEDPVELDDDVARAKKLLDKIREENDPTVYKSKERQPANHDNDDDPAPTQGHVQTASASQGDIDALVEKLRKGSVRDRIAACTQLGNVGGIDEVPHLIQALDDKESVLVRKLANDALMNITEQDFKYDASVNRSVRLEAIDRWEDWYKEQKKGDAESTIHKFW